MDSIRFLEFDVRGTNVDNRIPKEKIPLKDKTCPWVIPNASPFFGEYPISTLWAENGEELIPERDFWFEGEFGPFCDLSGRSITSFIRLSEDVRKNNTFITVTYQSIGAYFVPRNNLEEWVKEMQEGKIPVPWDKIFNVPPELPAEFHSHSAKTEIGDWYELSYFFQVFAELYKTRDPLIFDKADQVITQSFEKLKTFKAQQLERLNKHDKNYNAPHAPTKGQVGAGAIDNFATATLPDELAGVANNLFSTPGGVNELSKLYVRPTPDSMPSGIFPISKYGSWKYLPKTLSGSFEGNGRGSEMVAVCLEEDGTLMLLGNHHDGRTGGLFFSKVEGYNTDQPVASFTGQRYDPPAIAAANIVLDRVVSGSGGKVLMVGKHGTNNWYLCLPNNSFDPRGHALVKCDMTAVGTNQVDPSRPGYSLSSRGVIHHMGEYLVLVQSYSSGSAGTTVTRQAFFRVKTADVLAGTPVAWGLFNVTYTNYDGTVLSNQAFMALIAATSTTGGYSKLGPFSFSSPLTGFTPDLRVVTLSAPKAASPGVFKFTYLCWYTVVRTNNGSRISTYCAFELTFDFNVATGVFTPTGKTAPFTLSTTQANRGEDQHKRYDHLAVWTPPASTLILDTGELVTIDTNEEYPVTPVRIGILKITNRDTPEAVLTDLLSKDVAPQQYRRQLVVRPVAPMQNGMYPSGVCFLSDGELFAANSITSEKREIFYREVAGPVGVQAGAKNVDLGDIRTRVLTDEGWTTNLLTHDPMITLTGTATDLTNLGVDAGFTSLSACGYSSPDGWEHALPTNPALRSTETTDALLTFPRKFSWTKDSANKRVTFQADTFYGLSQNAFDTIVSFVPVVFKNGWCFSLFMLNQDSNAGFTGTNIALVQYAWKDDDAGTPRQRVIALKPTLLAAPEGSKITMITGFTVWDDPIPVNTSQQVLADDRWAWQFTSYEDFVRTPLRRKVNQSRVRPMLSLYQNGTTVKAVMVGCHLLNVGEFAPIQNIFDINLTTKVLSGIASGGGDLNGENLVVVPRYGWTDYSTTVIKHPGTTFPPATSEKWTCRNTGVSSSNYYLHPADSSLKIPGDLVGAKGEGSGVKQLYCKACGAGGADNSPAGYRQFIGLHYIYTPTYTPPPATPEYWTCKVTGTKVYTSRDVGGYKIPTNLNPSNDRHPRCGLCNTEWTDYGISGAAFATMRDNHMTYTPPGPDVPDGPDDVFIVAGPLDPYRYTGGTAAIFKRTVGSTISYFMPASIYPANRWVVSFAEQKLLANGTSYDLPEGTIDLRDLIAVPQNRTFYVYATIDGLRPGYVFSTSKLRKRGALLLIALVTTNANQILTIERYQPVMIGEYQLSHKRDGGIIPVSSGFPQDAGIFSFVRNAELLS